MGKLLDMSCLRRRGINDPMQDGVERLATTTGGEPACRGREAELGGAVHRLSTF
jgi:hypothetical protein